MLKALIGNLALWAAACLAACAAPVDPPTHEVERNVVYGMYAGTALLMDVHRPSHPNGRGMLWINGSGWQAPPDYGARPLKGWVPQVFLDAGFTVFDINHRGAPTFQFPAAIDDAARAVRFVRHYASSYGIDPDRIGAVGASSGGHLASLLGVMDGHGDPQARDPVERESAKLQAVGVGGAPQDFADPTLTPSAIPSVLIAFLGGTREEEPDRYAEASPVTYVSADDPPFLLVHGEVDTAVPFDQAERMKAALEAQGVLVELVGIPEQGHGGGGVGAPTRWLALHLVDESFAASLNPVIEAHDRLAEGWGAVVAGDVDGAMAAYGDAGKDPRVHVPAANWLILCWGGGRYDRAVDTSEACEKAVDLDPENPDSRDSRGIVRALLGDIEGAVEDFEFFIPRTMDPDRARQRQGWVEELKTGANPFTPEILQDLDCPRAICG